MIMYQLAQKLGFGKELVQELQDGSKVKGGMDEPDARGRSCARSTAAAGPSATPASRPSG